MGALAASAPFCYPYSMNALWLTRFSAYRYSPLALPSATKVIGHKVARSFILLHQHHVQKEAPLSSNYSTLKDLLLFEARSARIYWRAFRQLIPPWCTFIGRNPQSKDVVNHLLDIGYHHLASAIRALLEKHDIPTALALIHVARTNHSDPLVYDLMELFRADVVDAEVMRFLNLKKKPVIELTQKEIAHFLHEVNERLERLYYVRNFKSCEPYRYYMELQILRFISAIDHKKIFEPLTLPARHEDRC